MKYMAIFFDATRLSFKFSEYKFAWYRCWFECMIFRIRVKDSWHVIEACMYAF
jgi:hypothetical protein